MKEQKRVLIVEDEKSLRSAMADTLKLKGFTAIEARNGKEGLDIALREHPDLILLDIIMPEMDGMTALRKIREDAWGKNAPIIVLTNKSAADEKLIENMVAHKPLFYLVKSDWKIHDILQKVEEVIENKL